MLRRLLQGTTRATLGSYVLIAVAGLLFLVQFLVLGWWFAAIAVIPLVGSEIINTRKIHVAARAGAPSNLAFRSAPQAGASRPAGGAVARSHATSAGRLAAAMEEDPERSARLFEMTGGMGSKSAAQSGQTVLGVARDSLAVALKSSDLTFVPLNPSIASTQIQELESSSFLSRPPLQVPPRSWPSTSTRSARTFARATCCLRTAQSAYCQVASWKSS